MIKILDHFEDTESKTVFKSGPHLSDPRSSRDAPRLWRELDGHDGRLLSLSRRLRGKIWQSSDMKTRNFCVAGKRCWLQRWRLFWWRHRRRRRREGGLGRGRGGQKDGSEPNPPAVALNHKNDPIAKKIVRIHRRRLSESIFFFDARDFWSKIIFNFVGNRVSARETWDAILQSLQVSGFQGLQVFGALTSRSTVTVAPYNVTSCIKS